MSIQVVLTTEKLARDKPRSLDPQGYRCHANDAGVKCVATNDKPWPAAGCTRGVVTAQNKTFATAQLKVLSQTVCFGTLGPYETKSVEVKWEVGEPSDICSVPDNFGNKRLNWDLCSFELDRNPVPLVL